MLDILIEKLTQMDKRIQVFLKFGFFCRPLLDLDQWLPDSQSGDNFVKHSRLGYPGTLGSRSPCFSDLTSKNHYQLFFSRVCWLGLWRNMKNGKQMLLKFMQTKQIQNKQNRPTSVSLIRHNQTLCLYSCISMLSPKGEDRYKENIAQFAGERIFYPI